MLGELERDRLGLLGLERDLLRASQLLVRTRDTTERVVEVQEHGLHAFVCALVGHINRHGQAVGLLERGRAQLQVRVVECGEAEAPAEGKQAVVGVAQADLKRLVVIGGVAVRSERVGDWHATARVVVAEDDIGNGLASSVTLNFDDHEL